MNLTTAVNQIDTATLQYAPLALSTIGSIEQAAAGLPGETKAQIAISVIQAAAVAGESVPIPQVAAISEMINLFVAILNATGLFNHHAAAAPAAAPAPAAVA